MTQELIINGIDLSEFPHRAAEFHKIHTHPNRRPKDAATLIILDRAKDGQVRILMGKRHMKHKFMPGRFVFPGGRVDQTDSRVPYVDDYHPAVLKKMTASMKGPKSAARARALAIAAIRETYEEAGIFIGRGDTVGAPAYGDWQAFKERRIAPSLESFFLICRAITPPKRIRRFDTRFLAIWSDAIADQLPGGNGPTEELQELHWLTIGEAKKLEMPFITELVLTDLENRLRENPELDPNHPAPFIYRKHGGMQVDYI